MIRRWRERARALKLELTALAFAARDPRTPRLARVVMLCVVAYAFSPLDLIPDPIPVLGYLDDLVLLPLGIVLALRLVPPQVMIDSRRRAGNADRSLGRYAAAGVVLVWIALATAAALVFRLLI